jgi:hypothetical protein
MPLSFPAGAEIKHFTVLMLVTEISDATKANPPSVGTSADAARMSACATMRAENLTTLALACESFARFTRSASLESAVDLKRR